MKNKKLIIILATVLVVLAGVFLVVNHLNQPQTIEGAKTIEVEVVFADGSTKDHTIHTDEEFLRGALEQEELISGSESEYGLYVTTVDGVTADDAQKQWWCFNQDGVMLNTGVDSTPIADGDHYEIVLSVY